MKTITQNIFSFSELSPKAKEKALSKWNETEEFHWGPEYIESIEKGLEAFGCSAGNYSIDCSSAVRSYVPFSIDNENIEELSGQRLRTWLLNNHYENFFERKGQGSYEERGSGYNYKRRSRIKFEETSCPFTGVSSDEDFMDAFREFIKKPDGSTFKSLVNDAIRRTLVAMEKDYESQQTEEYFADHADANDMEFYEDGTRYFERKLATT